MANFLIKTDCFNGSNYQIVEVKPHKVTLNDVNTFTNMLQFLQQDVSIFDYTIIKKT